VVRGGNRSPMSTLDSADLDSYSNEFKRTRFTLFTRVVRVRVSRPRRVFFYRVRKIQPKRQVEEVAMSTLRNVRISIARDGSMLGTVPPPGHMQ